VSESRAREVMKPPPPYVYISMPSGRLRLHYLRSVHAHALGGKKEDACTHCVAFHTLEICSIEADMRSHMDGIGTSNEKV